MTKTALILSLLALTFLACQQPASEETTTPAPEPAAAASDSSPAVETEAGVEYEPAYPTDVSAEELSEDDVAQQETTHAHDGGEEHAHEGDHGESEKEAHDGHQH